jgi:hypothetical protein
MMQRSQGRQELLAWSSPHRASAEGISSKGFFAISDEGLLSIGFESMTWFESGAGNFSWSRTFPSPASRAGFKFESRRHPGWHNNELGFWETHYVDWQPAYRNHQMMVRLPWWSLWMLSIIVGGIYFPWWWRVRVRESRARGGQCIACGYDLRASPQRCPECGRLVSPTLQKTDAHHYIS